MEKREFFAAENPTSSSTKPLDSSLSWNSHISSFQGSAIAECSDCTFSVQNASARRFSAFIGFLFSRSAKQRQQLAFYRPTPQFPIANDPSSDGDSSNSNATAAFAFAKRRRKRLRVFCHRALVLLLLLALSIALFYILLRSLLLSRLLPHAFNSEPHAHLLALADSPAIARLHSLLVGLPLPPFNVQDSIGSSAVVVVPAGTVRAPYSKVVDHLLKLVTLPILTNEPRYITGNDFSVIIPVRNEEDYLPKTLSFLFEITPEARIREVIVVDDNSAKPIKEVIEATALPSKYMRKIKFIRFDKNEGLIRARVAGAAVAVSENLFFLDGHCRPREGWAEPLIAHLKTNYRRIACPQIFDIFPDTWENVGTSGEKMMFEWTFEFNWYYEVEVEAPILPGGILALTKKWWIESGEYDVGMLEWGGENIEQSIRVWLCGGEIYAVRESRIGHIFARKAKPNPNNQLVIQVQKNQKRAAKVWLDEYYNFFYKYHSEVRRHEEGGVQERRILRHERLHCLPFQWITERFRAAFERFNLLDHRFYHVLHEKTGLCLSTAKYKGGEKEYLIVELCDKRKPNQRWSSIGGRRMLANKEKMCIDAFLGENEARTPGVWPCDWENVLAAKSENQFWQWDFEDFTREAHSSSRSDSNTHSVVGNNTSRGESEKKGSSAGDNRESADTSSSISGSDSRDLELRAGVSTLLYKSADSLLATNVLPTGRIFSFIHPDIRSFSGNDELPVLRAKALSGDARCLVVETKEQTEAANAEEETNVVEAAAAAVEEDVHLSFAERSVAAAYNSSANERSSGTPKQGKDRSLEKSQFKPKEALKTKTYAEQIFKGKNPSYLPVFWQPCGLPLSQSRFSNIFLSAAADEGAKKTHKNTQQTHLAEIDGMRFAPKWVLPPVSSRYKKITLNDSEHITDASAQEYVDKFEAWLDSADESYPYSVNSL